MDQFTQALPFFLSTLNQTFNPILGFTFLDLATTGQFVNNFLSFLMRRREQPNSSQKTTFE